MALTDYYFAWSGAAAEGPGTSILLRREASWASTGALWRSLIILNFLSSDSGFVFSYWLRPHCGPLPLAVRLFNPLGGFRCIYSGDGSGGLDTALDTALNTALDTALVTVVDGGGGGGRR